MTAPTNNREFQETAVLVKRKKRKDDNEIDITPMIDCVFLLLSFFVFASKMDPKTGARLPHAANGSAVVEQYAIIFMVTPDGLGGANIYKGKSKDPAFLLQGSPEEKEQAMMDYIRAQMSDPRMETVLVKAERGIKFRDVHPIHKAASAVIAESPIQFHWGVEEKKDNDS
jgi:biopolymer transport protein ExbD